MASFQDDRYSINDNLQKHITDDTLLKLFEAGNRDIDLDSYTPDIYNLILNLSEKFTEEFNNFSRDMLFCDNTYRTNIITQLNNFLSNTENTTSEQDFNINKIIATKIIFELGAHEEVIDLLKENCNKKVFSKNECTEILLQLLSNTKNLSDENLLKIRETLIPNYLEAFKSGGSQPCDFKTYTVATYQFDCIDSTLSGLIEIAQSKKEGQSELKNLAIQRLFMLSDNVVSDQNQTLLEKFKNNYLSNPFLDNNEEFNLYVKILEDGILAGYLHLTNEQIKNLIEKIDSLDISDFNTDHNKLLNLIENFDNQGYVNYIRYSLMQKSNNDVKKNNERPIDIIELFKNTTDRRYETINSYGTDLNKESNCFDMYNDIPRENFVETLQKATENYITYIVIERDSNFDVNNNGLITTNDGPFALLQKYPMIFQILSKYSQTEDDILKVIDTISSNDSIDKSLLLDFIETSNDLSFDKEKAIEIIVSNILKRHNKIFSEKLTDETSVFNFLDSFRNLNEIQEKYHFAISKNIDTFRENIKTIIENINTKYKEMFNLFKKFNDPNYITYIKEIAQNDPENSWKIISTPYYLFRSIEECAKFCRINKLELQWIKQFYNSNEFNIAINALNNVSAIDNADTDTYKSIIPDIARTCYIEPSLKDDFINLLRNNDEFVRESAFEVLYRDFCESNLNYDGSKLKFTPDFDPKLFLDHLVKSKDLSPDQYLHLVNFLIVTDGISKIDRGLETLNKDFKSREDFWIKNKIGKEELIELIREIINDQIQLNN